MDDDRRPSAKTGRIEPRVRVRFFDGDTPVFGPGVYRLLGRIRETGSLNQATQCMGMSYSKAWRIVRDAEDHLGLELLHRRAGGEAGGGSTLTAEGEAIIERYARLTGDLEKALDVLYERYFGDQPFAHDSRAASGPLD